MEWFWEYLAEQVRHGLKLSYFRNNRGYRLFWTGKGVHDEGLYEVRQGMLKGIDTKQFTSFAEAYNWLLNGTPIKRK